MSKVLVRLWRWLAKPGPVHEVTIRVRRVR